MNAPDLHISQWMDQLTQSDYSFALWRLPWTDECHLVMQTSGKVEELADISELNGKRGFVISPFLPSDKHPLVYIRPDISVIGWEAIEKTMFSISQNDALQEGKHHFTNENPKVPDKEEYEETFHKFIVPLQEGKFKKLVLSRTATQELSDDFSPIKAFIKACNSYPRMMIYLCHTPVSGTWIGSTPEILLSGEGKRWHTVALAGTMPMQGEVMPENWTPKNKEEQALVADYVSNIVKHHVGKLEEKGPYTARAGQLVHLKTDFHFQLKGTQTLGDLLKELHPTPAVCGLPKKETYAFITTNEKHDRRYYSGFIGWMDPDGQTDIYVNLRCMEIQDKKAILYAGGGILPSSDIASEWEETHEKMKTMRNIL